MDDIFYAITADRVKSFRGKEFPRFIKQARGLMKSSPAGTAAVISQNAQLDTLV